MMVREYEGLGAASMVQMHWELLSQFTLCCVEETLLKDDIWLCVCVCVCVYIYTYTYIYIYTHTHQTALGM